jgi:hypothetical protein
MTELKKVYADFNDRDRDGACVNLWLNDRKIDRGTDLRVGEKVVLYQDLDFTVIGLMEIRNLDWVAIPDWSTIKYTD